MKNKTQKSGEKAFVNIFSLFPKRYLLLGLLSMSLWQGCGKDETTTPTPEPTPATPKKDTPTEFVMKTDGLPEGVSVDIPNKIITVPLKMPNDTIISFFKKGVVSDADGNAGVETIEVQGDKIVIVIWGTNGKTNEKETQTIKYTINRQAKAIKTNDIAWYEEPRSESIVAYYKEQKETIDGMRIPAIRALLQDNVLKPTNQKTTVLEVGEHNHIFGEDMKKLINNIEGIDYILINLEKYGYEHTLEMKNELKEIVSQNTQNKNFLLFEDNSGGAWMQGGWGNVPLGDIFEQNNQTYAATAEDKKYEVIANEGHSKVSLPVYKESDGKWYFIINRSWSIPENNPFTNSIESPLIGGVDFGSSSGASAANAATWALGIQLLQRMGIQVDKQLWNTILEDTEYDECFEPAYWIDPNTKEEYIKGKVLIWSKFIGKFNVFGLNNEAIKNLQPGQRVPLLKHWDKIDNTKLILQEEKGIVRENNIVYLDYDLLDQQGINPEEFIKNPEYKYIIGDKKTKKLYWKPEE